MGTESSRISAVVNQVVMKGCVYLCITPLNISKFNLTQPLCSDTVCASCRGFLITGTLLRVRAQLYLCPQGKPCSCYGAIWACASSITGFAPCNWIKPRKGFRISLVLLLILLASWAQSSLLPTPVTTLTHSPLPCLPHSIAPASLQLFQEVSIIPPVHGRPLHDSHKAASGCAMLVMLMEEGVSIDTLVIISVSILS